MQKWYELYGLKTLFEVNTLLCICRRSNLICKY